MHTRAQYGFRNNVRFTRRHVYGKRRPISRRQQPSTRQTDRVSSNITYGVFWKNRYRLSCVIYYILVLIGAAQDLFPLVRSSPRWSGGIRIKNIYKTVCAYTLGRRRRTRATFARFPLWPTRARSPGPDRIFPIKNFCRSFRRKNKYTKGNQ